MVQAAKLAAQLSFSKCTSLVTQGPSSGLKGCKGHWEAEQETESLAATLKTIAHQAKACPQAPESPNPGCQISALFPHLHTCG